MPRADPLRPDPGGTLLKLVGLLETVVWLWAARTIADLEPPETLLSP